MCSKIRVWPIFLRFVDFRIWKMFYFFFFLFLIIFFKFTCLFLFSKRVKKDLPVWSISRPRTCSPRRSWWRKMKAFRWTDLLFFQWLNDSNCAFVLLLWAKYWLHANQHHGPVMRCRRAWWWMRDCRGSYTVSSNIINFSRGPWRWMVMSLTKKGQGRRLILVISMIPRI